MKNKIKKVRETYFKVRAYVSVDCVFVLIVILKCVWQESYFKT